MLNQRRESGFTMVEVIVGAILLTVIVGIVASIAVSMGSAGSSLTASRGAQRDATEAMEQLRNDLAAARSPAYEQFDDRRETLRDLIGYGHDAALDTRNPSRQLCGQATGRAYVQCLSTLTYASGSELWLRVDLNSNDASPADCVGYRVEARQLSRYVGPNWRTCGPASAATMSRTVLATGTRFEPTRSSAYFRYVLRSHPSLDLPLSRTRTIDPDGCRTRQLQAVTDPDELSFVTSVEIDFEGQSKVRRGAAHGGLTTSAAISSHVAADHAYAVGCAP